MGVREQTFCVSPFQYLEEERRASLKRDYLNGQVIAMAGGSYNHNMIQRNVTRRLATALENRKCVDFTSDMKIRIDKANQFRYPDASALCGPIDFYDDSRDAVCNPQLIVEVLSPSTEQSDRTDKFATYRLIESFSEYLLLSQSEMQAEVWSKKENGEWVAIAFQKPGDIIELESIAVKILLGDLYDKCEFE